MLGSPHRCAGLLTERAQTATTQTGRMGPKDPSLVTGTLAVADLDQRGRACAMGA